MNYFVYIQLKGARWLPLNDIITLDRLMLESCILFLLVLVEFLVLLAIRIKPRTVIEKLREGVGEHLEDADNKQCHHDPFPDFLPDICFDYLTEAKPTDQHDKSNNDCCPNHELFTKCFNVHNYN